MGQYRRGKRHAASRDHKLSVSVNVCALICSTAVVFVVTSTAALAQVPPSPQGYSPQPVQPRANVQPRVPGQNLPARPQVPGTRRPQPGVQNPQPSIGAQRPGVTSQRQTMSNQRSHPAASPLRGPVFRNPIAIRQAPVSAYDPRTAAQAVFIGITQASEPGSKLQSIAATGDIQNTREAVAANLRQNTSLSNYMAAVDALGRANAATGVIQPYRSKAQQLAYQQVRSGAPQPLPWIATAGFALQDQNQELFRATTHQILQKFPDNPHGHYFEGVQAIEDGDWRSAEQALKRSEELGMPKESVAELLRLVIDRQRWVWEYAIIIAIVGTVWAIGLACIYILGVWLSRSTLLAAERDDPAATNAYEHRLRWLYRRVIDLAGAYYFLSLPILLVFSVAFPLALAYAALMLPYLNLWVVALFLIGGLTSVITAISGIRTAFVRIPDQKAGRLLNEHEAKAFWEVLGEVAENVGTRPVDEVWITPQTDMAVLERGGSFARRRGKGRRALIMGIGLVPGFRVDALKAVLAHEYAHFQHGDTAGGDVALRVRAAMIRHAEAIADRGVIQSWDIAIWYLKFYYRLFNKLTFGASRLQEVLADRLAVEHYGSTAFIAGLGHVVRRDIEFDTLVNEAVSSAVRSDTRTVAFYAPKKTLTSEQSASIANQVRDVYQLPETPGDSHPSLAKRFAAVHRLGNVRPLGPDKVVKLFDTVGPLLASEMRHSINVSVEKEAKLIQIQSKHALEQVESAIDSDPTFELIETRAVLNYRVGEHELALDDLNLLLEVIPNDLNVLLSRSNLYGTMGDDNRMARDLIVLRKNAAHLPKDLQFDVEMRLGTVLAKHGKHAKAALAFDQAICIVPDSANAILGRLLVAEKLGTLADEPMRELVARLARLCPEESELRRIAPVAGVQLHRHGSHAMVNKSASRGAAKTATTSLLIWISLATAASIGVAAAFQYWPRNSTTDLAVASPAGVASESQLNSILDSAIPAIPNIKLPIVKAPALETPQASKESEEPKKNPVLEVTKDHISIARSTRDGRDDSERALDKSIAERLQDQPPSASNTSLVDDEPEPEPVALSPRQLMREARSQFKIIGNAFRKRDRKEGLLLASQEKQNLSWRVHALPYLGLQDLYEEFELDAPWDSEYNKELIERIPEIYQLESSPGNTRFRVLVGDKLLVRSNAPTESRFALDGPGETTLAYFVGRDRETIWTKPDTDALEIDRPFDSLGLESDEPFIALMASGAVRAYETGIHPKKLLALATAQGAEAISERNWFSNGRSKEPPPRVVVVPKRAKGDTGTKIFVRLPRVKSPQIRMSTNKSSSPDPIDTRLRQIGLALHNYFDTNRSFPLPSQSRGRDANGEPMLSWRVHLLPFLDQRPLYERFRLNESWDSEHNRELIRSMPAIYASDQNSGTLTRFLGLAGPHQFFEAGGGLSFAKISDGTSNTIAVVHIGRDKAVPWTKPVDLQLDLQAPSKAFGRSRGSIACLRVDGRVMHLPRKTPADAWAALATYRGGELIDGETLRRFGEHAAGRPLVSGPERANDEKSRMKKIMLAMHNYADGNRRFPANRMRRDEENRMAPLLSWRVEILPYLEHGALYKQFHRDEPWDSEHNRKLIDYMPDIFRDADDLVSETRTRIQVLTGDQMPYEAAAHTGRGPSLREFTDGLSNTILIFQVDERRAVPWTQPADLLVDATNLAKTYGRASPEIGRLVGMADGAVQALPPDIPTKVLSALSTHRGGEVVDDSWRYGN